jgi:2-iminobutanoate/2-iminopropanoate deaminase
MFVCIDQSRQVLPPLKFSSTLKYPCADITIFDEIRKNIKTQSVMSNTVIYSAQAPEPIGPYSQAIRAGNMLFVSGQIAIQRTSGNLVTGNVEDETTQVMINISEVLKAAGFTFADVVKCSIFLKDMGNFPKVNEIYGQYFTANPPARETVEVSRLPKDVNVEISCIAVRL